jgi:uncharacterized coiled-coil protein SlyX
MVFLKTQEMSLLNRRAVEAENRAACAMVIAGNTELQRVEAEVRRVEADARRAETEKTLQIAQQLRVQAADEAVLLQARALGLEATLEHQSACLFAQGHALAATQQQVALERNALTRLQHFVDWQQQQNGPQFHTTPGFS